MSNGYRDQWGYAKALFLGDLPANNAAAGALVEIDVTSEQIVGVEVETDGKPFDYVFAASSSAAHTLLTAGTAIRRVFATGAPYLVPCKQTTNKLYIRGVDDASAVTNGLSYTTLQG